MTTQDLGQALGQDLVVDDDPSGSLGKLFDSSPARSVQTSVAAVSAFVLGLLAFLAVPFSLAMTLCLGMAGVALVTSIIGVARASKRGIAGGVLASVGMVLALVTLALVGLRYIGLDTAFGDDLAPTFADWLDALNALVPAP